MASGTVACVEAVEHSVWIKLAVLGDGVAYGKCELRVLRGSHADGDVSRGVSYRIRYEVLEDPLDYYFVCLHVHGVFRELKLRSDAALFHYGNPLGYKIREDVKNIASFYLKL